MRQDKRGADGLRRNNPVSALEVPAGRLDELRSPRLANGPSGTPLLHAVIVHHSGQELLDRCLRSLAVSRDVSLQTLVVANACSEALPELLLSEPGFHLLRCETPVGFSAANNRGVAWMRERLGQPHYYFFVNNDTVLEPDTLSTLVKRVEADADVAIAGPRLMIWGTSAHLNSLGLNLTRDAEAWDEGIGRTLDEYGPLPGERTPLALTGSALLVRAKAFEALGGWLELYDYYYEDVDFCLRAWAAGFRVLNVPNAVMWHAISATAVRGSDFKLYHTWRNRLLLMAVHWPVPLLLTIAPGTAAKEWRSFIGRLRSRCYRESRIQFKAWLGFLMRLPHALSLRLRRTGRTEWTALLRPCGSVPEIRLPPLADAPEPDRAP